MEVKPVVGNFIRNTNKIEKKKKEYKSPVLKEFANKRDNSETPNLVAQGSLLLENIFKEEMKTPAEPDSKIEMLEEPKPEEHDEGEISSKMDIPEEPKLGKHDEEEIKQPIGTSDPPALLQKVLKEAKVEEEVEPVREITEEEKEEEISDESVEKQPVKGKKETFFKTLKEQSMKIDEDFSKSMSVDEDLSGNIELPQPQQYNTVLMQSIRQIKSFYILLKLILTNIQTIENNKDVSKCKQQTTSTPTCHY
eukprot:TRINITY_DN1995_c0_g1_i1.p7 TRINITY_DN1995_c0_g1~~TRINITY_DN1995_c0_g1_i1.p7  ORF type:complete len:251 (-),score=43.74 TRINITY_DN1995_c0_g1_i1:1434-2186(-)